MKTDELINAIVADNANVNPSIGQVIAAAFGIGIILAAIEFAYVLDVRPDFAHAITHEPRFIFKFVFTIGLAIPAAILVARLSRPDGKGGLARLLIALPVIMLIIAVLLEMFALPPDHWMISALGTMPGACMTYIPLISIAPFVAILAALRFGAPANPVAAGAAAGLVSAAIGAAFYAAFCIDDSPMFVAIWYVAGISIVTALGALAGKLMLRW
jgi:hypothetical protein